MKSRSLQYCIENLNPDQVTAARELRGMTKKELADRIGKSPSAMTRIEKGQLRPEIDTLLSLSQELDVHHNFFVLNPDNSSRAELTDCHFRSRRSTSLVLKRMAKRHGERISMLLSYFENFGINFLEEEVSQFSTTVNSTIDVEKLAYSVRSSWGLGIGPISDLMTLLESKGVRVFMLSGKTFDKVDAFSIWIKATPCIFLYRDKPASRLNFDLAHELGHLLFHQDVETGDNKTEREADKFASAFLLPQKSFLTECPRRWSLQAYVALKKRWKVSIAAMLYRAKELRIFSESSYRRACIAMSTYRKNEPGEFAKPQPELFSQVIELIKEDVSLSRITTDLGYHSKQEVKNILAEQGVSESLLDQIDSQTAITPSNLVYLHSK